MKCPFCGSTDLKVTDSRESGEANAIRRRRECQACHKRFTTFETIDSTALQVKKRDGRYQDFQSEKLVTGLERACRHTRISRDQVLHIASKIQEHLITKGQSVVSSKKIGDFVMNELRNLDGIAYIRFACEYRRFKDVEELIDTITLITPKDAVKEEPVLQKQ